MGIGMHRLAKVARWRLAGCFRVQPLSRPKIELRAGCKHHTDGDEHGSTYLRRGGVDQYLMRPASPGFKSRQRPFDRAGARCASGSATSRIGGMAMTGLAAGGSAVLANDASGGHDVSVARPGKTGRRFTNSATRMTQFGRVHARPQGAQRQAGQRARHVAICVARTRAGCGRYCRVSRRRFLQAPRYPL